MDEENRKLIKRNDNLQNRIEELQNMTREDTLSFQQDYHSSKKKLDKFKIKLMETKKHLNKLMDIEVKYDMLQDEINETKEKDI